jgi:phosphate starvation-inducible PhoH-like protein
MVSKSITVCFDDGALIPFVYGDSDSVIRAAEEEFHVEIYSRGGRFVIHGRESSAAAAERFLESVYALVKHKNGYLSVSELQSLLQQAKHGRKSVDVPAEDGKPSASPPIFNAEIVIPTEKGNIMPTSPRQRLYVESIYAKDLVFASGPAGTGKTFLAVAAAVSLFLQRRYQRVILCRPAVEAGEKIGFLPGDMKDKIDPYMQPLYDALNEMIPADKLAKLIEKRAIEITPIAFMRGRTLKDSFIILDEAQNATAIQMKMFLTRIGERSKMVICGDMSQIDLEGSRVSGFSGAISLLQDLEEVSYIRFREEDIVRHKLVRKIIEAYERQGLSA